MMYFILLIGLVLLGVYLFRRLRRLGRENEDLIEEERQALLLELLESRTSLSNEAFNARKALLHEALKSSGRYHRM